MKTKQFILSALAIALMASLAPASEPDNVVELHKAAMTGKIDVLKAQLERSSDSLSCKTSQGTTLLHSAALGRQPMETIQFLVDHNADVNAKDNQGESPLHVASRIHRAGTVTQLLALGADANAQNDRGETPLHLTAIMGLSMTSEVARRVETAQTLISNKADLNAKDKDGRTPLHVAAVKGRTSLAELLLKSGADIQAKDKLGRTPLHFAALMNRTDVIEILLDAKASTESTDKEQKATPLLATTDNEGNNALHVAAMRFRTASIELLLKKGIDVNALNNKKQTPLMILALQPHGDREVDEQLTKVAKILIAAGAKVDLADESGLMALDYAKKQKYQKMTKLLSPAE